jgi:hypothetical protein
MTENEIQDDYAYKVAIASVIYNIENRNDLSDISKVYIDWISEYTQRVNKTLDSILDESYIFTPHFVEVVRALANKKDLFKDEISKHKEEFNLINSKLDKLKTNPKEFYESADSEYIFKFIKKIEPFFQTPSVPVMTCCGEDIDKDD